jgi:hypothetical protein
MEWTLQADSITVYPLNTRGADFWEGTGYRSIRPNTFLVTIDLGMDHTLWYGVERYGQSTAVAFDQVQPTTFQVYPPFPNPSNGSIPVSVSFQVSAPTQVAMQVFDVQGRLVFEHQAGKVAQGRHAWAWPVDRNSTLANGMYFVRLAVPSMGGQAEKYAKVLLLR